MRQATGKLVGVEAESAEVPATEGVAAPEAAEFEVVRDEPESVRPKRPTKPRIAAVFFGTAAILIGKVVLARWLMFERDLSVVAVLSEIVLVIAVLGLVDVIFRRWRFTAYFVLDVVVSLFLVALTEYVVFFERMMAPGALKFAGQLTAIVPSIINILGVAYVLFVIDLPVLMVFWHKLHVLAPNRVRRPRGLARAVVLSQICAIGLVVWAASVPTGADDVAVAKQRGLVAFETGALARTALAPLGLTGTAAANRIARGLDYTDPVEVQTAIDRYCRPDAGERIASFAPGEYKGAHVILIQVESLQNFAVDPWITPNLDQLIAESWYFPNGFSQSGLGTTSDAEFAANTSLYPPRDNPASVAYVNRTIPGLPRLLIDEGYYTFTMHANTIKFWNRKELYPSLGFSEWYDRTFFGTKNIIGMGASDRTLFKKALPVIVDEASKGPIYCQLITLSPHHPFEMPRSVVDIEIPDWLAGSTVGQYFESMNYEDRQLGWFINALKKNRLWDESIVVIYGDHAGLRSADLKKGVNMERVAAVIGHSYTAADKANIPIFIHLPGQQNGETVTTAVGQVSIMPTIADALGFDLTDVPHFGRSVFEGTRPLLVGRSGLPAGSFINERIVCVAGADLASSQALTVDKREPTELHTSDAEDYEAVQALEAISDEYVKSLPPRESQGTSGAILPRKVQTKKQDW